MDRFAIRGGVPLRGTVEASGSKNAVLALMAASLLTEEQVVQAVSASSTRAGLRCNSFTAFPSAESFPHYVILVEFERNPGRTVLRRFLTDIDRALATCNVEYGSKRKSLRLGALELWISPEGAYASWRHQRAQDGGNFDQVKPVHLTRDPSFHRRFEIVERICAD